MIYWVKAKYKAEKAAEFFKKLTDGSISNQKPDGQEMVSSMKRARITAPGTLEWFETCYCSTPLQHERATVYDFYLTNITTREADDYGEVEGDSFWEYLSTMASAQ